MWAKMEISETIVFKGGTVNKTSLIMAFLLVLIFPASLLSWSDDTKWKLAERRDSFSSYHDYLDKHPEGDHVEKARRKAALCAAEEMLSEARGCGKLFPSMAYFAIAAMETPTAETSDLDFALSRAAACEYSFHLDLEEMREAVDGLLKVRAKVKDKNDFSARAMMDLDRILLDLEQAIVDELNSKIFMCDNQSAWTDTSAEEFQKCAGSYIEEKDRLVNAAGAQLEYDLNHISRMEKDYRADFWKRYASMSDSKAFAEFVVRNRVLHLFQRAGRAEEGAIIKMRIDRVISRVNKYRPE